jgi:hypothetical protein
MVCASADMKQMIEKLESLGLPQNPEEIIGGYVISTDTAKTEKIYRIYESKNNTLRDMVLHYSNATYIIIVSMREIVDDMNALVESFSDLGQGDYNLEESDSDHN